MILRAKLVELLAKQDIGDQLVCETLEADFKEIYEKNADEIIALFSEMSWPSNPR